MGRGRAATGVEYCVERLDYDSKGIVADGATGKRMDGDTDTPKNAVASMAREKESTDWQMGPCPSVFRLPTGRPPISFLPVLFSYVLFGLGHTNGDPSPPLGSNQPTHAPSPVSLVKRTRSISKVGIDDGTRDEA